MDSDSEEDDDAKLCLLTTRRRSSTFRTKQRSTIKLGLNNVKNKLQNPDKRDLRKDRDTEKYGIEIAEQLAIVRTIWKTAKHHVRHRWAKETSIRRKLEGDIMRMKVRKQFKEECTRDKKRDIKKGQRIRRLSHGAESITRLRTIACKYDKWNWARYTTGHQYIPPQDKYEMSEEEESENIEESRTISTPLKKELMDPCKLKILDLQDDTVRKEDTHPEGSEYDDQFDKDGRIEDIEIGVEEIIEAPESIDKQVLGAEEEVKEQESSYELMVGTEEVEVEESDDMQVVEAGKMEKAQELSDKQVLGVEEEVETQESSDKQLVGTRKVEVEESSDKQEVGGKQIVEAQEPIGMQVVRAEEIVEAQELNVKQAIGAEEVETQEVSHKQTVGAEEEVEAQESSKKQLVGTEKVEAQELSDREVVGDEEVVVKESSSKQAEGAEEVVEEQELSNKQVMDAENVVKAQESTDKQEEVEEADESSDKKMTIGKRQKKNDKGVTGDEEVVEVGEICDKQVAGEEEQKQKENNEDSVKLNRKQEEVKGAVEKDKENDEDEEQEEEDLEGEEEMDDDEDEDDDYDGDNPKIPKDHGYESPDDENGNGSTGNTSNSEHQHRNKNDKNKSSHKTYDSNTNESKKEGEENQSNSNLENLTSEITTGETNDVIQGTECTGNTSFSSTDAFDILDEFSQWLDDYSVESHSSSDLQEDCQNSACLSDILGSNEQSENIDHNQHHQTGSQETLLEEEFRPSSERTVRPVDQTITEGQALSGNNNKTRYSLRSAGCNGIDFSMSRKEATNIKGTMLTGKL